MSPVNDIYPVDSETVSCDGNGNGNGLGHPLVYLNLGKNGEIDCPYCGRKFIYTNTTGQLPHEDL